MRGMAARPLESQYLALGLARNPRTGAPSRPAAEPQLTCQASAGSPKSGEGRARSGVRVGRESRAKGEVRTLPRPSALRPQPLWAGPEAPP